jgi:hypothetical protein
VRPRPKARPRSFFRGLLKGGGNRAGPRPGEATWPATQIAVLLVVPIMWAMKRNVMFRGRAFAESSPNCQRFAAQPAAKRKAG